MLAMPLKSEIFSESRFDICVHVYSMNCFVLNLQQQFRASVLLDQKRVLVIHPSKTEALVERASSLLMLC